MRIKKYFFQLAFAFFASVICARAVAQAAGDLENKFNFDGYLLDATGNPLGSPANLTFQIYNPAGDCLLYEESHTGVVVNTDGAFSVKIGGGSSPSVIDGDVPWSKIFQNTSMVRSSGTNCASSYTPAAYDRRKISVTVNGTVLTPMYDMSPVPMATVAETLQGKALSAFSLKSDFPACSAGNALSFDGSNFGCIGVGSSGAVTTVSSANSYLGVTTSGSAYIVTANVGVSPNTLAAGDDARLVGALQGSQNLSALTSQALARTNLGLGPVAVMGLGTSSGTVAAGDDQRINGALQITNNLAELSGAASAAVRTNLGISSVATMNIGVTGGTIAAGNDSRFSDSRNPIGAASGDLTGTYPSPTVNMVGGFSSSAISSQLTFLSGATSSASVNNLVKRGPEGAIGVKGLDLVYVTSVLKLKPYQGGFSSYDIEFPFDQGFSEQFLMNDGPGNALVWQQVPIRGGNFTSGNAVVLGTNYSDDVVLRTNSSDRFFIKSDGKIGFNIANPIYSVEMSGDLKVAGSAGLCVLGNSAGAVSCTSDRNLKENITEIPDALNKLNSIRGIEFDWNYRTKLHGQHAMGVIAQEVQKVFPLAVKRSLDGYLLVDYAVLVAPLIQATKELHQQNNDLKSELQQRDKILADLEARLRRLEASK